MRARLAAALLGMGGFLGACQTVAAGPAVLTETGTEAAKAAVAEAIGRSDVVFGEPSPQEEPVLVVLPRAPGPYQDRSLDTPIVYDIRRGASGCVLAPRAGGDPLPLPAGSCTAR